MSGRDPHEPHRVATPLELLFDLTFVIAFGVAAGQFAHSLASGHVEAGLISFSFATFSVCWAWINFSWFASAYDTDDWVYRLTTMLQMVGVLVLALGIPPVFSSIAEGAHVDNRVLVGGYVVMRVAMVIQWLRAAGQDPARKVACLTYAGSITVAQLGWIAVAIVNSSVTVTFVLFAVMVAIELTGPLIAEKRKGGTPWHAHHIAERNGLLTIIALGEGVVGTVASLSAMVAEHGWTTDAALVAIAGTGLTFGMWWVYFVVPAAQLLHAHRERSFGYGYLHIAVFGSIVATGAGLHAAADSIEHRSSLDAVASVVAVAAPVGLYIGSVYGTYLLLTRAWDGFYTAVVLVTLSVLGTAVGLAVAGVSTPVCLLVVAAAPAAVVAGYEWLGHQRTAAALAGGRGTGGGHSTPLI
ncbi:low temperature requirement protein A [Mycobacterium sp.]|uniref:low temperature requirement protein A n=1 Tax=Mycobacterium sp. TaxID=1785 RepID=UPI0025EADA0E|nr:low temperature requirement protein A [Mycobacterium sp.]